jgi:ubiquinone/menaquinone biosynthesis C-methylase UbiE
MKKETILQKSWIWNKSVSDFVKDRVSGYSLNVCAGENKIGDVKIDLDPKDRSTIKADMKNLPFPDETFDTVISDPPWKIGYYDRWKPFLECVRVCKVGGKIIYNAYWLPWSKQVELKETFIRQDSPFANTSVISIFKRTRNTNEETLPLESIHKSNPQFLKPL